MPREFTTTRRVEFADTDLAGVMHFANYFRMMEEAEHEFWRSVGLSVTLPDGDGHLSWPRVSVSCDYHGPVYFEDILNLTMGITAVGDKSFSYQTEFLLDGSRRALGKTTAVCCTMKSGKFQSVRIPEPIRALLES